MSYHDDLLAQALLLVHVKPQTQASLRRSVSAAYYSVFHLLIAEATSNWGNVTLRAALGRAFDHGPMKQASKRVSSIKEYPFTGVDPHIVASFTIRGADVYGTSGTPALRGLQPYRRS